MNELQSTCFVLPSASPLLDHRLKKRPRTSTRAKHGKVITNTLSRSISRRAVLTTFSATVINFVINFPARSASETASITESKSAEDDIDPEVNEPEFTDRVYLDIAVAEKPSSRVIIGLYGNVTPKTVDNFKKVATSTLPGTDVYRIVPGLTVQLGDVLHNGGKSGKAATVDGQPMASENFRVKHTIPGIVSMVRNPDGRVDSRFFITTRPGDSAYLDGRYVGFGRVVEGMEYIYSLEKQFGKGFVKRNVKIVDSGLVH